MKESIGGTQIFLIVIALILIFTGIMSLTINHSNAFSVKDSIVSVVENAGGFDMTADLSVNDDETLQGIVDLIQEYSYRQKGKCPESTDTVKVVGYERNGSRSVGNNDSSFCIVRVDGNKSDGAANSYIYKIIVFYRLDLPVLRNVFSFKSIGETKSLYK